MICVYVSICVCYICVPCAVSLGRWGGTGKSRGKGNHNQSIVFEKISVSKHKDTHKSLKCPLCYGGESSQFLCINQEELIRKKEDKPASY